MNEKAPTLLPHPANDNSDVVERLAKLLDAAKAGELTDFACVYLQPKEFCFAQSFRNMNRSKILMCLEIIKKNILAEYEVDPDSIEC